MLVVCCFDLLGWGDLFAICYYLIWFALSFVLVVLFLLVGLLDLIVCCFRCVFDYCWLILFGCFCLFYLVFSFVSVYCFWFALVLR